MDWLWGSSTPANGQQQPGTPAQPATVAMHQRPLVTVTKEHKDQFFNQFEAYTKEQEDKESIICVDTPTLKIWRKQLPGEEMHLIKFIGTLNYPLSLIDYVLNDPEKRKTWDTVMENWEEHNVDEHLLVYLSVKLPFPLYWRDFVHLREIRVGDSHKIVLDVSTSHPKFPEKSGYVRASTIFSGLKLTKIDENTTQYMTVSQADFAGLIPKSVVNYIASSQPQTWFQNLEQACAKFKPEWEAKQKK